MIDEKAVASITRRSESVAEKHLAKLGVDVQRLDHHGPKRRTEFALLDRTTGRAVALSEVKTLISAGHAIEYDEKGRRKIVHHSTLDPETLDGKARSFSPVPDSYRRNLMGAVDQYKTTVTDEPKYRGLPFLVVLFSDFMPDSPLLDQWVLGDELPEISGVLRLVHNREFYGAAARIPTEQLKRRILVGDLKGLPPEAFEWRLVPNPSARHPVPKHLALCCLS